MIDKKNIRLVHVEASSRCNSHCPMCSRYTADGFVQPGLVEGDLEEAAFYKLFTPEFTSQLEHVYFSGVYGDPCLNKKLPEFVKYLVDNGCGSVSIDTNGGYRNEEWWAELSHSKVQINFALDGASNETLNKYRIGVVYDKVLANLKAYLNAGGNAQWNFIVFKHNEHEVETARELAKQLGADFRIKVTQKFRRHKDHKVMKGGLHIDTLFPPITQEFRHSNVGGYPHMPISVFKFDLTKYKDSKQTEVNCKSLERKEVFLTASGLLLPCCYLGTYTHDSPGAFQFNEEYSMDEFNLNLKSVDAILDTLTTVSARWGKTVQEGNLITCLHTCGSIENTTLYHSDKLKKENILKIKND